MAVTGTIHYYVHGRGRGHATRSLHVVKALRSVGHAVQVFAGEDAQALFAADCTPIRSVPVGVDSQLPTLVRGRVSDAMEAARQDRAALIVSDGDMPAVLAAKGEKLPSIAVGHGLVFACCKRPAGAKRLPWLREAAKATAASLFATHHVPVNFVSLPVKDPRTTTLARPELEGAPADLSTDPSTEGLHDGGPVVCYFRDGDGDRYARSVAEAGYPVVLFGQATGSVPHVEYAALSQDGFTQAMTRARCVISSAGSQLMSECLLRGIPQLALFAAGDDEQQLNAHMLNLLPSGSLGMARDACDSDAIRHFLAGLGRRPITASGRASWPALTVSQAVCEQAKHLAISGKLG